MAGRVTAALRLLLVAMVLATPAVHTTTRVPDLTIVRTP